ncbi:MAG: DUF5103 domain-containing protein [Flavobacteriaceae bacterium]
MRKLGLLYCFLIMLGVLSAQENEVNHIKSIQLKPLSENNFSTIVPLGTTLELSFDDLEADQKDYSYKVQLMTYDWKPSNLIANQYINGFQSNVFFNVENSFNTLQNYTHYSVRFPNQNTRITKSGNYLVSVLNEYDEVMFTRRFILYESTAVVGVSVTRGRDIRFMKEQQTVNLIVNHASIKINNPSQEIHVAILQNENWNTALTGVQPQFYKSNQLIYRYTRETNFWGGNEYLHFDNKLIRNGNINISRVEKKDIFHSYLYPYKNRVVKSYTYNPDINGQFVVRTIEASNPATEADYAQMYFSLKVANEFEDKEVYVYGAFNNFQLTEENKMSFDSYTNTYSSNFLLKQGFYNYTFVTKSSDGSISESEIRGNFSQTENNYTAIVYFKPFGSLFDRVIGVGTIRFQGER